jgi:hypothetical protein
MTKESIFPDDIKEASDKMGGEWVKASEFEVGLVLQIAKPMEKKVSSNPKYGGQDSDFLVKNDILEKGECLMFTFNSTSGEERKFNTKSAPFFIAFKQVEELGIGDWIKITRTGKTDETRYTVEKVDGPQVPQRKKDVPTKEINPDDVPF